jgi:DNA-binding GntR family transcriptional regulator
MPLDLSALPAAPETRPTLAEAIAAALAEAITRGEMPPGTTLEEERLALIHGASRTPVREALRLLVATGLVEQRPRRGAVVARPEPQRVAEMFAVMAELEAICARLCAFHEALYQGAGNAYLAELAEVTRRRLAPFRAAQLGGKDRLAASHAEHGAIIEAICAGDGAAAAAAMRAHLAATEGSLGVMAGRELRF